MRPIRSLVPSRWRAAHRASSLLGPGLALLVAGCSSSLTVTRINSAEAKPNNVWVFFTVQDGDEPVAGLEADDFDIYEDEKLVSEFESKQTIQNPDVAAVMYTMLLLDMSGSITESGEADALVDAAQSFVQQVEQTPQKVGVYAFDGGEKVMSVVPFTEATGSVEGGLEGLRTYRAKDPSTNLNGAVVQGLDILRQALDKDERPLKFGTLVVFSDGTDRAGRVPKAEMLEAMDKEEYAHFETYAIGVGAEMEQSELSAIGRNGTEMASDGAAVDDAFAKVAKRIEQQSKRFYLLSYCTPSRKGEHRVRIQANRRNDKGKVDGEGSLEYVFQADGFGPPPECDPERKPNFPLDRNLEPAPPPEERKSKKRKSGGEGEADADLGIGGR
jgi:hypothetical protein